MGALNWAVNVSSTLLTKFGKPAILYRKVDDAPAEPNKPWRPDGLQPMVPTEYPITIVIGPNPNAIMRGTNSTKYTDGSLIQQGDLQGFIAAKELEKTPAVGDIIKIGEERYKVILVTTLAPGPETILYEIVMRG